MVSAEVGVSVITFLSLLMLALNATFVPLALVSLNTASDDKSPSVIVLPSVFRSGSFDVIVTVALTDTLAAPSVGLNVNTGAMVSVMIALLTYSLYR